MEVHFTKKEQAEWARAFRAMGILRHRGHFQTKLVKDSEESLRDCYICSNKDQFIPSLEDGKIIWSAITNFVGSELGGAWLQTKRYLINKETLTYNIL